MRFSTRFAAPIAGLASVCIFGLAVPASGPLTAQSDSLSNRPRGLAALLADANRRNSLPTALVGYTSNVETEFAILIRREQGIEAVVGVEDVASRLRWERSGLYDQHVTGYRAQRATVSLSTLSAMTNGWLTPTLYGNRFRIRARASGSAARAGELVSKQKDTLIAVHPLADDRDRYYLFSGGDTIVQMLSGVDRRQIPIVQVRVQPRPDISDEALLFDGEIDLDASRGTLVRMRGALVRLNNTSGGLAGSIVRKLVESVAFIEFENAEREENYWLPSVQRIELQVASPLAGDARAVVRIVSRFTDMSVQENGGSEVTQITDPTVGKDSINAPSRVLSYAPRDSIGTFDAWRVGIGKLTQDMHSDDFNDVGPDRWRPTGSPRVDVQIPLRGDLLHFNRVEGLYTAGGLRYSLRDRAPGVVIGGNVGWAWSEQTVRGRFDLTRTHGAWRTELRTVRSLDNTNDFRAPFDSGASILSIFGSDDPYDYVDRRSTAISLVRATDNQSSLWRLDFGVADDRYRAASVDKSPFRSKSTYRENRGVDEGGYIRSAALFDWNPEISAAFVREGMGARVAYERGDGTLNFQRAEARFTARRQIGPFTAIARADAGAVWGDKIPPQKLFELGKNQALPGYAEKEFAGNRAAILRGQLQYTTSWYQTPIRFAGYVLPGLTPGLSVGMQGGVAEANDHAARASILRLGTRADSSGSLIPVARESNGLRATASAGIRFFAGSVFIGIARPIDHDEKWRGLVSFGQQW